MKKLFFYTFILLCCSCSSKTYKQGQITYAIHLDEQAEKQGMARNIGTEATVRFNKKYLHLKRNTSNPSNEFEIVDLKTGQHTQYVSVFDSHFAILLEDEALPDLTTLKMTEETKEIAGLTCKKATWQMNGRAAYVYFTESIKPFFCPFIPQEYGFAMEYQLNYPYGQFVYTATETNFEKQDKRQLLPPANYKKVSPREYQMALFKRPKDSFIGKQAPETPIKDLNGLHLNLADLKGRNVLVNFWFTSCSPCVREIPALNKLKKQYRNENIEFLAITFDEQQTVRDFLVENPFAFRIFADARELTALYGIQSYPTTLFIDESGKVVDENIGGAFDIYDVLDQMIQKNLD